MIITVLDYSTDTTTDTTTVYTSQNDLSEEEIKNLIRENHKWEDTYYMVSDGLTLNIKSI